MNKLILAAMAFATLTSVSTIPASAAVLTHVPGSTGCTSICNEPNDPKTPGGTTVGCDEQLGHLRRVYKPQVAGVDEGYRVWVTELCPSFGMLRSEGNAAYLRTTIAGNEVLVEALSRKAYGPDDVFAVQMMGDDTINLYVRHFGR